VRTDLNNAGYDKTQNERIDQAISKIENLAAKEGPSFEQVMQKHLLGTKKQGNLSFSNKDDADDSGFIAETSDTI